MASSVAKVLVFAGSAREGSLNKQLAKLAARRIEALGGKATFIDLKAYPCPLFDEDIEAQGMPENVLKLREILADHQALLIASPEYNGFITPLLKNTLDWLSRPYGDTPGLGLFAGGGFPRRPRRYSRAAIGPAVAGQLEPHRTAPAALAT